MYNNIVWLFIGAWFLFLFLMHVFWGLTSSQLNSSGQSCRQTNHILFYSNYSMVFIVVSKCFDVNRFLSQMRLTGSYIFATILLKMKLNEPSHPSQRVIFVLKAHACYVLARRAAKPLQSHCLGFVQNTGRIGGKNLKYRHLDKISSTSWNNLRALTWDGGKLLRIVFGKLLPSKMATLFLTQRILGRVSWSILNVTSMTETEKIYKEPKQTLQGTRI